LSERPARHTHHVSGEKGVRGRGVGGGGAQVEAGIGDPDPLFSVEKISGKEEQHINNILAERER